MDPKILPLLLIIITIHTNLHQLALSSPDDNFVDPSSSSGLDLESLSSATELRLEPLPGLTSDTQSSSSGLKLEPLPGLTPSETQSSPDDVESAPGLTSSETPSSPDDVSSPELTPLPENADNATIYKISEKLCKDCPSGQAVEYVYSHNIFRAKKGLPPVAWDAKVANYAAKWADERRHGCEVEHSTPPADNDVGENIYWGSGKEWKPMDAVAAWADEEKFYDYESNTCKKGEMCGHYTQLMWNTTEKVGCAQVVCDTGDTFITCNYSPPGNYEGEKPY